MSAFSSSLCSTGGNHQKCYLLRMSSTSILTPEFKVGKKKGKWHIYLQHLYVTEGWKGFFYWLLNLKFIEIFLSNNLLNKYPLREPHAPAAQQSSYHTLPVQTLSRMAPLYRPPAPSQLSQALQHAQINPTKHSPSPPRMHHLHHHFLWLQLASPWAQPPSFAPPGHATTPCSCRSVWAVCASTCAQHTQPSPQNLTASTDPRRHLTNGALLLLPAFCFLPSVDTIEQLTVPPLL